MRAEMRRKEKQITDPARIEAVLNQAQVLRLAMCRDGQPYVVPLCFAASGGKVYLHSAGKGLKLEYLAANPKVCFEVESEVALIPGDKPCAWSMRYQSVIGFGTAGLVEDATEKTAGLNTLAKKYEGRAAYLPPAMVKATSVIRIDVTSLTGKTSGL